MFAFPKPFLNLSCYNIYIVYLYVGKFLFGLLLWIVNFLTKISDFIQPFIIAEKM